MIHSIKHTVFLLIVAIASTCLGQTPPAETLRVLSYNIHMWEPPVEELTAVIRATDADIVGLNEAWSEKPNNALAKALGYNVIYGGHDPARRTDRRPHWINGYYMPQVLLTKHKIVESKYFNAMAAKEDETNPDFNPAVPIYRGGTLAVLETAKGNRLAVFVLHLHPWGGGDNEKMTSMRLEEIKGILSQLELYKDMPVLIIGDHNTQSHHDVDSGKWKVTKHLEEQGWTDLYRTVKPNAKTDPGLTCGKARIDYIFHNRLVTPVDAKVLESGVFQSKGYDHSDHLGVLGTVKVGGG